MVFRGKLCQAAGGCLNVVEFLCKELPETASCLSRRIQLEFCALGIRKHVAPANDVHLVNRRSFMLPAFFAILTLDKCHR